MWWAIIITIAIPTIIIFLGAFLIKPKKYSSPGIVRNNHGKDIKTVYDNLKNHNITLNFDYNKRKEL